MVDEFQDTNAAQYELLKLLSSEHNNICVVGDDDQSIYSWRGAIMMNILNFEKDYPNTKVIKLEQNYRSTQKILELSNTIIKNNRLRADKTLYTERKFGVPPIIKMLVDDYAEAQYVVDKIKELIKTGKYKYKDFAIFVRTNNQTRLFEEKLRYANIPYIVIGAVSFYSRKEIKDVIAYLKFIVNPSDSVSLERIINTPKRNIGDTTIEKISMFANINKISLFDACLRIDEIKEINSSARERIKAFTNLMNGFINRAKTESVETIITDIIDDTGYRKALEESDDIKDSSRIDNINELINSACEFVAKNEENPTTVAFLEKITMFSETDKIDASKNYVNIMTYHCAKGLEFFVVFMVGVEEHILPHIISIVSEDEAAIEEERRLCYVGITRAKDILYLTHTARRYKYNDYYYPKVSRFILEAFPEYTADSRDFSECNETDKILNKKTKNIEFVKYDTRKKISSDVSNGDLSVGKKVRHNKYGVGKVVWIDDRGEKIKVSFPSIGVKLLATKVANLKII